ncbi:MAG: rhomboid family intramembrane serine protease [Candidatus Zixiibacteriota bacterium]|nr:MAG: rhomboid family intramembrane serine protease [candidate division Zixibacteria bacterium]
MRPYNPYHRNLGGYRIGPGSISPVIKYLLITNGIVYLLKMMSTIDLPGVFGLTPAKFYSEFPNYLFQPLTYMFLHASFLHIFFNMFALWMFGTEIEYHWKSRPFLKFYILCGLGGALLSLIFNPGLKYPIVGASGAIYGVLVAYWFMFPDRTLYIFFMFPMKVRWAIPLFGVLNFLISGPNVAHLAHLGGALVAFAYIKIDWRWKIIPSWFKSKRLKKKEAKREKNRQKAEEIMKRVDKILDKINEVGIENISKEDRKFLEDASHILSNKDNKTI